MHAPPPFTSFQKSKLICSGKLADVALAIKALSSEAHPEGVLIFDNATGHLVDVDFRGSDAEMLARLPPEPGPPADPDRPDEAAEISQRGPGRPRLGVVAREVTLLPRHWQWLAAQPGGASVILRRLVDEARHANADRDKARMAQERAYRFMSAIASSEAGFEEASRALFAGKRGPFEELSAPWPADVRDHALLLATDAFSGPEA